MASDMIEEMLLQEGINKRKEVDEEGFETVHTRR